MSDASAGRGRAGERSDASGILFLCVANSARSVMAEGLARRRFPDRMIRSAGSAPTHVHPLAVRVMGEIGIDVSQHVSTAVTALDPRAFGWVITLCAEQVCPVLPGATVRHHWPLPDPAAATGDETTRLEAFRGVRDELERRIATMARELAHGAPDGA